MNDITEYSDNELSLLVMNDEYLYNMRHSSSLFETLDDMFTYTQEQLDVLKSNLEDEEC